MKDPHSSGSDDDITAQTALLLKVRNVINSVVWIINESESIRRQLYDLKDTLQSDDRIGSIVDATEVLDNKIISVEENLYEMKSTGRGQDYTFREPGKLITRLVGFVGNVSSADFPPTTQLLELYEEYVNLHDHYFDQFNVLLEDDIPAFNNLLQENDISHAITFSGQ
jgi:hypothetical protein